MKCFYGVLLICSVLILRFDHGLAYTSYISTRFSDILRKGSHINQDGALNDQIASESHSPTYQYVSPPSDDNGSLGKSAGNILPTIVQAQSSSSRPAVVDGSSQISPTATPVTYTSRIQVPHFQQRGDLNSKQDLYRYSTSFPLQNQIPNHSLRPFVLQPIIQYIIQLPQNPYDNLIGKGKPNDKSDTTVATIDGDDSNIRNDFKEIIEEMDAIERQPQAPTEERSKPAGSSQRSSTSSKRIEQEPSTIEKDTMDNLMTIIEHMNNVSDASVAVDEPTASSSIIDSSTQENPQDANKRGYDSTHTKSSTGNYGSGNNKNSAKNNYRFGPHEFPPHTRPIVSGGYGYGPSQNSGNNMYNSGFQPLQLSDTATVNLFNHVSDQITQDLNYNTGRLGNNQHSHGVLNGRNGNSFVRGVETQNKARQNNFQQVNSEYSNSYGGQPLAPVETQDPYYGEGSTHYATYSNEKPSLDKQIYHTLHSILAN